WAAPYVSLAEQLHFTVFQRELDVQKPATRGEVVQTIHEAFAVPISAKNLATFADVPSDHRFAATITLAYVYGIIDGDSDAAGNPTGTFRPDDTINRASSRCPPPMRLTDREWRSGAMQRRSRSKRTV